MADNDKPKKKNTSIKRLFRSRNDKIIGGVCGGVAQYLRIDPVLVRIIGVLLLLSEGIGFIIYIVAWILIPENPRQKKTKKTFAESILKKTVKTIDTEKKKIITKESFDYFTIGFLLLIIGIVFLAKNYFPLFSIRYYWPLIFIIIGVYLMIKYPRDLFERKEQSKEKVKKQ